MFLVVGTVSESDPRHKRRDQGFSKCSANRRWISANWGPEGGNFLTWHLMGCKETIQCSLGQAVPLISVHQFRARLARGPRSRWRRREDCLSTAFEVTAFVHLENRAGATEIAILAPERDGLKYDCRQVCT
jgi:hypothetical protein